MRPSSLLAALIFGLAAVGCSNGPGTIPDGHEPDQTVSPTVGASAKKCVGEAQQCAEQINGGACYNLRGCNWSGQCTGFASDCILQYGSDCSGQKGCKRNATDDACDGVPTSCSKLKTLDACDTQSGCSWTYACNGDAGTCDELSADECSQNFGCRLK